MSETGDADVEIIERRSRWLAIPQRWYERLLDRLGEIHPAALLTGFGVFLFVLVFGRLGVQNQRNFGTWSYDMGIYDQGFWLVSRGGSGFMTVRGMDFWGHHVNLIAFAFAPFYWLGAGPSFLYVVQALFLGLAAIPTYLIARDRLANPWFGLLFAFVYLMYAPIQWISWAMFHPEALVIAPFLFAWWFGVHERWTGFFVMLLVALAMREDVALAAIMLGIVLAVKLRHSDDRRGAWTRCAVTVGIGAVWYLAATRVVLPHFNDGKQPFYLTYFYGNYGSTLPAIVRNMVTHPGRVFDDATRSDRLHFYGDLGLPLGMLPLLNPLALLMAAPQMVASVIGLSPYARMIKYQYTSVMIAPIMIAAIDGAHAVLRYRIARVLLPIWLVVCSYGTNVHLSPSPIGTAQNYAVWSKPHPVHQSLRNALAVIPADASVTASYQLLPHLSHRREIYDWPNPFSAAVWGNDDCDHLPDPRTVDYVAIDRSQIGATNQALFDAMFADGGPFVPVYSDPVVIVGRRVGTSPEVDVLPQQGSCQILAQRHSAG